MMQHHQNSEIGSGPYHKEGNVQCAQDIQDGVTYLSRSLARKELLVRLLMRDCAEKQTETVGQPGPRQSDYSDYGFREQCLIELISAISWACCRRSDCNGHHGKTARRKKLWLRLKDLRS